MNFDKVQNAVIPCTFLRLLEINQYIYDDKGFYVTDV